MPLAGGAPVAAASCGPCNMGSDCMRYLVGVVKRHPASLRVIQRMRAAARVPVLLVGLLLWAGLLLSAAAHITPVAYADTSKPSVTILLPAPASNAPAHGAG